MKKDQAPAKGKSSAANDNRVAQRHQKQSQASQLSAANVEESPHMDQRDSAAGAGESLGDAPGAKQAGESFRRGALDTQYGTKSSTKAGSAGRASSGGSGTSGAGSAGAKDVPPSAPNPGSSEESSGSERDTMSGPRPGSGS